MANRDFWIAKMPLLLKEKMDFVARERVKQNKDIKTQPYKRIGLAIARDNNIWNNIIKADFIKDKRGQVGFSSFNIFTVIIVTFMAAIMMAGMIYTFGLLNDSFIQIGAQNEGNAGMAGYANLTLAAQNTFGQANSGIQSLRLTALCLIFSMFLGTFVVNAMMRIHPVFFFVYILICGLAIIFSVPISNTYELLLHANTFNGVLVSFTGVNWIILNLPIITSFVGVIGGIFMFINILRSGNEEVLR